MIRTILAAAIVALSLTTAHAETQISTVKIDAAQSVTSDPVVRDHRTDSRDHRSSNPNAHPGGGVTVGPSSPRHESKCVKSVLGGPCIGIAPVVEAAEGIKNLQNHVSLPSGVGPNPGSNTRDHRTGR